MNNTLVFPIIGRDFTRLVIPLIKSAKNRIDIIVYEWRWYPDQIGSEVQRFNNAIIAEAKKNIQVRVITNSPKITNFLKENKIQTKLWSSGKTLHTKLMIIDNRVAILGSHNYTMNGFMINYEVSVAIMDVDTVVRLKQYFYNLWQL